MVVNICNRLFEFLSCKKKRSCDGVLFELESSSAINGLSNLNPEDLEKTLDSQISAVHGSDSLEFDFKIFDKTDDSNNDILSTILTKFIEGKNKHLLKHPIIEAYLLATWKSIKLLYLVNLSFYLLFLIILTYGTLTYTVHKNNDEWWSILAIFLFCLISREILQMRTSMRWNDYLQFDNFMEWIVITTTITFLILLNNNSERAVNAGAIAMLLGWINWTLYLADCQLIGSIINVSSRVAITLIMVVIVYLPVLIGFTLFFHFSMENSDSSNSIFLKPIAMVSGDFDMSKFTTQNVGQLWKYDNKTNKLISKRGHWQYSGYYFNISSEGLIERINLNPKPNETSKTGFVLSIINGTTVILDRLGKNILQRQKWIKIESEDGFFMLQNPASAKYLTAESIWTTVIKNQLQNVSPLMTSIAAAIFMFLICIIITNILIGLTVNKTEYFMEKADMIRLEKTALECQRWSKMELMNSYNKRWIGKHKHIKIMVQKRLESQANIFSGLKDYISKVLMEAQGFNAVEGMGFSSGLVTTTISSQVGHEHFQRRNQNTFSIPAWVYIKAKRILVKLEEEIDKSENLKSMHEKLDDVIDRNKELMTFIIEQQKELKALRKLNELAIKNNVKSILSKRSTKRKRP